jgi:hypothetical protein
MRRADAFIGVLSAIAQKWYLEIYKLSRNSRQDGGDANAKLCR